MFHLVDDGRPYRIVGLDPGTDTLGVACLDVDLFTGRFDYVEARTFVASQYVKYFRRMEDVRGARFVRLQLLHSLLVEHFRQLEPHAIITETPFFNPRRPGAFESLVEAVSMINLAVNDYHPDIRLARVDPAKAKARLGVSGKSSDKDAIRLALLRSQDLAHCVNVHQIAELDEHSSDALAIAYFHACDIRAKLFL